MAFRVEGLGVDKAGNLTFAKQKRVRNYESCEYAGGIYDSRAEANYAAELDIRQRAKEISGWRRQQTISLDITDAAGRLHHICSMRVDFVVTLKDGSEEWHEVKGFASREWEIKRNLFKALFPDRPYITIQVGGSSRKSARKIPSRKLRSAPTHPGK